ncbi:hypothetical protein EV359DRAFT_66359, partial [Lentinula novae-zelandiae]
MSGNIVYIELRTRNLELSAELRASHQTVFPPAPATSTLISSTATHSSTTPASGRLPKIETTFEPLTKEECCNIRFYHEKEWNDYKEQKKDTNEKAPKALGFLQAHDGTYTTGDASRLAQFYQHAKLLFNLFYTLYLDADSWGRMSSEVAGYFYCAMAAEFPELRSCNDGKWKARVYAMNKYPDWKRDYRDQDKLMRDTAMEVLAISVDSVSKVSKIPDPPLSLPINEPGSTVPIAVLDTDEDMVTAKSSNIFDTVSPASADLVSATSAPGNIPAESMTYGSEFSLISVLQHQTSQVSPQSDPPVTSASESSSAAMESNQSSSVTALASPEVVMTPSASSSDSATTNDLVDFAPKGFGNMCTRANPLAGFRIPLILKPPAPTSTMAPPKPKLTKTKKTDELMVADATSDMPRNLFALEYVKTHACTRAEFGGAWKALGDAGQKPWVLLSRKMRKDGKAKAIDVVSDIHLKLTFTMSREYKLRAHRQEKRQISGQFARELSKPHIFGPSQIFPAHPIVCLHLPLDEMEIPPRGTRARARVIRPDEDLPETCHSILGPPPGDPLTGPPSASVGADAPATPPPTQSQPFVQPAWIIPRPPGEEASRTRDPVRSSRSATRASSPADFLPGSPPSPAVCGSYRGSEHFNSPMAQDDFASDEEWFGMAGSNLYELNDASAPSGEEGEVPFHRTCPPMDFSSPGVDGFHRHSPGPAQGPNPLELSPSMVMEDFAEVPLRWAPAVRDSHLAAPPRGPFRDPSLVPVSGHGLQPAPQISLHPDR